MITHEREVLLALPGNNDTSLNIVECDIYPGTIGPYKVLWTSDGFDGEPHLNMFNDGEGLVLSVYTRTSGAQKKVVVLDLRTWRHAAMKP